jgi:UDP-glucose 4-epimerase
VVTGGAGFIGSNLARRLVDQGAEVVVVDNLSTGRLGNLAGVGDRLRFAQTDIRDLGSLRELFRNTEIVFHQAALSSVPRSVKDPAFCHEVNVTGTLNVLLAAREAGARRVVLASSSSVYGDSPTLPKSESLPLEPQSPYAASKSMVEVYGRVFFRSYGLETVSLRYFNVYGPRQDPAPEYGAVIPRFILAMIQGLPPEIFGDGRQSRDFVYVEDVVDANLLAATVPAAAGEVFNVGSGTARSLNELVEMLGTALNTRELEPLYGPLRPGDVRHSVACVKKARKVLGFRADMPFLEGLGRTATWFRRSAHQDLLQEGL